MISAESVSESERRGLGRAFAGGVILAAEYLALALMFDGSAVLGGNDWWSGFGRVGALVSISVAVFTAGLLMRGAEVLARLREAAANARPIEYGWVLAHAFSYASFVAISARVFDGAALPLPGLSITVWAFAGIVSIATLFRATFGSTWRAVARVFSGLLAAGLALGLLAWIAGMKSVPLWDSLAGATLWTSAWILTPFVDSVRVVPEEQLLGINDFDVTVAAPCSGMENIGAVFVFLLGYFYAIRERLKFPQSLLLLPVGLLLVWLANALRIAALVAVGAYWSPEVALGGFHSKAGWLALCLVALGVVVATRNSARFARTEPILALTDSATAAYLLPLLTFLGVGLVTGLFASGVDWLYPVSVVAAAAVAWHYRGDYPTPIRRLPVWGVTMGALAFALWIAFAERPEAESLAAHEAGLAAASPWLRSTWLAFRVFGAVAVVPFVEELAFRGYLQRRLIGDDFTNVAQDRFGFLSLVVSAVSFGLLHESIVAGTLAGAAYSVACYRRGRLEDAIVAHATTNALLVVGALALGYRDLWH